MHDRTKVGYVLGIQAAILAAGIEGHDSIAAFLGAVSVGLSLLATLYEFDQQSGS